MAGARTGDGLLGWRRVLRRAVLLVIAAGLLAVAGGLVLAAAWSWVAAMAGPVVASLSLAGGCALVALGLVAVARAGPRRPPPPRDSEREAILRALFAQAGLRPPAPGEAPPLVEAFVLGLTTALRLRRHGDR